MTASVAERPADQPVRTVSDPADEARSRRRQLEQLELCSLDVDAAAHVARAALRSEGVGPEEAYAALRGAAWRIVRGVGRPEGLAAWHALYTHCAALARQADRQDLHDRISTLAELLAQTSRFEERHVDEEVLERPHVVGILKLLEAHGGHAARSAIAQGVATGEANLSRLLGMLAAKSFVERRQLGKEASFVLTGTGRAALERVCGGVESDHGKTAERQALGAA